VLVRFGKGFIETYSPKGEKGAMTLLHTIGLLVTLALGLLVAPLGAEAPPAGKVYRIGWLYFGVASGDMLGGFRQGSASSATSRARTSPLSSAMPGGNTSGFPTWPPTSSGSRSTSVLAMGHRAATFVDKILNGATPADLPVEQAMKFQFLINLKTAKTLGITIPPHLLTLADEVVQ